MKLYLLQLGFLQPMGIPIPAYLIQTGDGTNILVDTGFPQEFIVNPPGSTGPLQLQVDVKEDDHITKRLAALGLTPDDIKYLICTHFDDDHAGNLALFKSAELVVQLEHFEEAQAGHLRFQRTREQWDTPDLHFRLIEGDVVLLPGIEIIKTSGHVPGHQSVLVRLPGTGPVLLAVDAIPAASMLDPETRIILSNDESEEDTRASTRKLNEIAKREGVQLIVHGHDAHQWPTLKLSPEFYD